MKPYPVKKFLISTLAVFVWISAFEMLYYHSPWMMEFYQDTPSLWRPMDEMRSLMPLMGIRLFGLAVIISCLYVKKMGNATCETSPNSGQKNNPYLSGVCFGAKIGALIGITQAGFFVYLPISSTLALAWLFGSLLEGIGLGVILAIICRKRELDEA